MASSDGSSSVNLRKQLVEFTAGMCAGATFVIVGHPLDTLKVRMQATEKAVVLPYATKTPIDQNVATLLKPTVGNVPYAPPAPPKPSPSAPQFTGMVDVLRQTLRTEGVRGLYRGVASPLIGVSVADAWLFWHYGIGCRAIAPQAGSASEMTIPQVALAGAWAGFAVAFVESPMELFKSKMQVQYEVKKRVKGEKRIPLKLGEIPKFSGVGDAAATIFRNYGIRGVYQGLGATFARNIPGNAAFFGMYETAKRQAPASMRETWGGNAVVILYSGALAGLACWTVSYPQDLIKTRMQIDTSERSTRKFPNMLAAAKTMYARGGHAALWRGYVPCALRGTCNAFAFLAYESFLWLFDADK